jgi:glutathione S-transferase
MAEGRLILIGWNRSPYARRVAISLHHYGLDFEHRLINAWDSYDDVAAANPIVKVPALITEDGTAIPESAVILDYLDCRVGPDRALMPPPSPARDAARVVVAIALAAIDKARELRYELHLRPDELRYEPFVERWSKQIASALADLDARAGDDFAAADRFTQADVTLGVMYDTIAQLHSHLLPVGRHPRLDTLQRRYRALPEFLATPFEPVDTTVKK